MSTIPTESRIFADRYCREARRLEAFHAGRLSPGVRPHPPVGKRKSGEGKVDQRWRQLLDACSTQPGYHIALSERHAERFIADAKAARTGEGRSAKNEPVK